MTTSEDSATIRDVRDAAQATSAALDAVAFINRETLPRAQVAALSSAMRHLRAALAGLDTLADGLAGGEGNGGASCGE